MIVRLVIIIIDGLESSNIYKRALKPKCFGLWKIVACEIVMAILLHALYSVPLLAIMALLLENPAIL